MCGICGVYRLGGAPIDLPTVWLTQVGTAIEASRGVALRDPWITDGITHVSPLGLGFTALMCLLILVLPRRYALVPVIAITCYMTMGERVVVAGVNFTMFRILILAGWTRLLIRGELRAVALNPIDRALIWWLVASVVTHVLLWQTPGALKYKLGLAYDALGLYFMFRFLLHGVEDGVRALRFVALFVIPIAVSMVVEKATGQNAFAAFGGVPSFTAVRDGVLRCQGPFAHPILAGTFGAVLVPIFVGLWRWSPRHRLLHGLAMLAGGVMTYTSASSGPVIALLGGLGALALWPLRHHLSLIRWGLVLVVLVVCVVEVVMDEPVWFVITQVGIFSGSAGYHRAYLIDRALANLGDWWLIGTRSTAAWGYDADLADVTNQYLVYGADGGLITMLLFILVIARCFAAVGATMRGAGPPGRQFYVWSLGAGVFAHALTFLSVSYFDQSIVNWYLLIAVISSARPSSPARRRVLMLLENTPYDRDARVRNEARALVRAGYRVTVICPKPRGDRSSTSLHDEVQLWQFPAPRGGTGTAASLQEYIYATVVMAVLSVVVWMREGVDIVHLHNPPDTLCIIGAFYRLFGKRIVFDHHDLAPELYATRASGRFRPRVHRALLAFERLSCRLADRVIAANESCKTIEMTRDRVPDARITIVRDGPEIRGRGVQMPHAELKRRAGTILGYVGVVEPQGGVDTLLRALHHLVGGLGVRDVLCVVIGNGDMLSEARTLAAHLGIEDHVWFAGGVPAGSDEFGRYLATMDIGVEPAPYNASTAHCTMITMMDYMAYGKPIVAFDLPEHRVTAADAALYAHPSDARDFAQKLAELIADPDRRWRMGEIGRMRIERRLAWVHQEQALRAAYTGL